MTQGSDKDSVAKLESSPKARFCGEAGMGDSAFNSPRTGRSSYSLGRRSCSQEPLTSPLKSPSKWYNPFARKPASIRPSTADNDNAIFKKPKSVSSALSLPNSPRGSVDSSSKRLLTPTSPSSGPGYMPSNFHTPTKSPRPSSLSSKLTSPGLKFGLKLPKSIMKSKLPTAGARNLSPCPTVESFREKYLSADSEAQVSKQQPSSVASISDDSPALSLSASAHSKSDASSLQSDSGVSAGNVSLKGDDFIPAELFMQVLGDKRSPSNETHKSFPQLQTMRHTIGPSDVQKYTPKKPPRPSLTKKKDAATVTLITRKPTSIYDLY